MTDDDRLRIELEALEGAAPAARPPSASVPGTQPRLLKPAPVTLVLTAGLLVGIGLLARLEADPATAPAAPSPSADTTSRPSASPPAEDLEWTAVAFPEPDIEFVPREVIAVDGRLIATGGTPSSPAAWYSDDGGATWMRSRFVVHAVPGASSGHSPMGTVVEHDGALLSASWRDMFEVPTEMWRSGDRGATWTRLENPPISVKDLAASERGIVAVGNASPIGNAAVIAHVGIWFSSDGENWQEVADHPTFAGAYTTAAAEHNGRFVAVGGAASDEGSRGGAAIWESLDGLAWDAVAVSAEHGPLVDVAAGPDGFVAVSEDASAEGSVTLWRSPDGIAWTPSRVELPSSLPILPLSVAIGPPGILITGTSAVVRVALLETWLVAPGSSLGTAQEAGYVRAATPYAQGFVTLSSCAPPTECYVQLTYGQPEGFDAPTPTLSGDDPSTLVPPDDLQRAGPPRTDLAD